MTTHLPGAPFASEVRVGICWDLSRTSETGSSRSRCR